MHVSGASTIVCGKPEEWAAALLCDEGWPMNPAPWSMLLFAGLLDMGDVKPPMDEAVLRFFFNTR